MPPTDHQKKPKLVAWAWVPAALFALVSSGFFFHTSYDPVVLGKYNLRYTAFLSVWFLVLVPGLWLLVRFVFTHHEIRFASGRRLAISPGRKLYVLLVICLVGYVALNTIIQRRLTQRTFTRAGDVVHPYLQNTPRPNDESLHTNRWGFRGDDIELRKPDNAYRIFVFGGSTVICEQVPFEQTHCRVLEKRLQAACPDVHIEVQNLGAEWHSSAHSVVRLLLKAQDFAPDMVVIWHGINDLVRSFEADNYCTGPYEPDYGHYFGAMINLVRPAETWSMMVRSAGGHWFSDYWLQSVRLLGPEGKGINGMIVTFFPRAEPVDVPQWAALPSFERNMRDFVEVARVKHCRVVLATQPALYRDDLTEAEQACLIFPISHQFSGKMAALPAMIRGMQQFNDATRRIARDASVPLVDLERQMPKTLEYMFDDVHYTPQGCEMIGRLLADSILQAKCIPEKRR